MNSLAGQLRKAAPPLMPTATGVAGHLKVFWKGWLFVILFMAVFTPSVIQFVDHVERGETSSRMYEVTVAFMVLSAFALTILILKMRPDQYFALRNWV